MRTIVFSDLAKADINDIWDYTVTTWGTDQAVQYNQAIEAACYGLAEGSRAGVEAEHILPDYHKLHVGRHTIYFKQSAKQIEVVRILHQRMDVERHFDTEE